MAFPLWDFKKAKTIKGKLTAKLSNIPPYGKKVYGITTKQGEVWYVWGSYQVVGHLAMLPFGAEIELTYRGMGEVVPGKPKQHLYDCKVISLPAGAKPLEPMRRGRYTPTVAPTVAKGKKSKRSRT